ncbi:MAG: amylo-alpha-1,6-glucosidase [Synergistaceae bacterium]|nr:amylo-alpha-1,6-glucosidase [Synergistaceae bacterium]
MYLGKADVNTYDKGSEREFLVSNGAGSYGSSTVIGANTRSEHGLLVVRPADSETHKVLVSKLEETLYAGNKKYQLSTNRYKDLIYPDGFRYLQEYQGTPNPEMLFVIHSIFLKKSIFMPRNGTCTAVRYELLESPDQVSMDIRPLFAHRVNSGTCGGKTADFRSALSEDGVVSVSGRGFISHVSFTDANGGVKWSAKPLWYENLIYERGASPDEPTADSLWSPGYGSVSLKRGGVLYVVLSEEPLSYTAEEMESLMRETIELQNSFIGGVSLNTDNSMALSMAQASCHLVAENKGGYPAIFSGFPSVMRRARDTFISLPGLTLAAGRPHVALGILESWLEYAVKCGMIVPASINAEGEAHVGDVDSGLWFIYAAMKYSSSSSGDFAARHRRELCGILEKYTEGDPKLGAVMDPDSKLLRYFGLESARNWMSGDAGGEPIVERRGYLVELNALWYNALIFMEDTARSCQDGESADKYGRLAREVYDSFGKVFWNENTKYLYDWVDPSDGTLDGSIRPNAILAVSLPRQVLPEDKGRAMFTTCWNELYTTYGLRTLDPRHEKFKGRSEGRPDQKQKARLRGMAWPWLLAHFITAYVRFNPDAAEMGWRFIRPFSSHLRRGCLGGVAEYFDGVMPYKPHGDVLSAASLGELMRVMHEDLSKDR